MTIKLTRGTLLVTQIVSDAVAQVLTHRYNDGQLAWLHVTEEGRDSQSEAVRPYDGLRVFSFRGEIGLGTAPILETEISGELFIRNDSEFPEVSVSGKLFCETWTWTITGARFVNSALQADVVAGEACSSVTLREEFLARE